MAQSNRRKMGAWSSFLDSLDTGGGHIFVLLVLIFTGIGVYAKLDATTGGQVITLAFGALLALTKATKSNREAINGDGEDAPPTPPPMPDRPTSVTGVMLDGGHIQLVGNPPGQPDAQG